MLRETLIVPSKKQKMAEEQLMLNNVPDLQRRDLKLWPLFSTLNKDFLLQMEMVMWYGKKNEPVNWETALILTKNKNIYFSCPQTLLTNSISFLPPQKIEALCQKDIKTMIHVDKCSFVLTKEGKVYSWGLNRNGMCGHGIDNAIIAYPREVNGLDKVVDIKCGHFHVLVLTDNRKIYSWGLNYHGQVNHTDANIIRTPTEVIIEDVFGKKDIQSISCGSTFNMAITCDGELYGWGQNMYGELGIGDNSGIYEKPIKIKINDNYDAVIAKVECGSQHTLALTQEGLLYAWGKNDDGQLGIRNCMNYISYPILINTKKMGKIIDIATRHDCTRSVAINKDKRIFLWGLHCYDSMCYLKPTDINYDTIHDAFQDFDNFRTIHNPCRNKITLEEFLDIMSETNLATAFNNSESADVKLIVNEQFMYIHKNVIMIRCMKMYKQYLWNNTDNVMYGNNYSLAAYKSFLKYLYTGTVDLPDEKPLEAYVLASFYDDETFPKNCIDKIKQRITILNVIDFYVEAISLNIKELEEFCFKFAISNMTLVVKTEAYAKLSEEIRFNFTIKAANAHAFRC